MRLDKFLSDMGAGTRTELKKSIKAGSCTVDGILVRDPGYKVTPSSVVEYKGAPVIYEEYSYYMLNKPAGIISASEDPHEMTVVDLIQEPKRKDLFPAGRLDRDTEGLLLITNDGDLAHRLLSPKHHVDKVYCADVSGIVSASDIDAFRSGLVLPDGLECLPADLEVLSAGDDESSVRVVIREGKFHQIKRMFEALGKKVIYLKRYSMGPLELDENLMPGQYRRLTEEELHSLKEI